MRLLIGIASAFASYSAVPMPPLPWDGDTRRDTLACFPLVGAAIGGLFFGWRWLAEWLEVGAWLTGMLGLLLVVGLTGGIHLDGFCDVTDALSSHQPRARKLAILTDSHIGAFAAIGVAVYLLTLGGWYAEPLPLPEAGVLSLGFVLSRSLSSWAAVSFPAAKREGMLVSFVEAADVRLVQTAAMLFFCTATAGMVWLAPLAGMGAVLAALGSMLRYRCISLREFGGVTGDLAGWFLCRCEWSIAAAVVLITLLERRIFG